MQKRRGPADQWRRRGGQGRTVNFRYGTPRKAGSGRRDKKANPQVAALEDDSFLLLSSCPTPPLFLRLPFERPGKLCEERRRLSFPTKVSLKIRETLRSTTLKRKRVLGSKKGRGPSQPPLVKAAVATLLIGCSSRRNCWRSPTQNLARRKYGLMSSSSFLLLFRLLLFSFLMQHSTIG